MRNVIFLIATVFISPSVIGQSKQFKLDELISLLNKDKFEVASVAMAKDYEFVQNDDNLVILNGFDAIRILNINKYALTAVFVEKDGAISNQPEAIIYMFEVNTEFAEFKNQLKIASWKSEELQSNQGGLLGKAYTNDKVKVVIGIIPADAIGGSSYKYFIGVINKDSERFDISDLIDASKPKSRDSVGDQGDKEGSGDSRTLYGNAGGGGSSLQMSGWMWDSTPKPNDTSSESGKLVFQVVIDNGGNIEHVKTLESSVSPTLEKLYRDEVMKLTFSKTSGASVATTSTGTITFVIKTK